MYIVGTGPINSFVCDENVTTKLDYLTVTRNHLFPDIDRVDDMKLVTFLDAIIYCNELSEREELEPVYSYRIRAATDLFEEYKYGERIARELEDLEADFTNNGYRLLTPDEMEHAINSNTITFNPYNNGEWVWNPDPASPEHPLVVGGYYGWAYLEDGSVEVYPHNHANWYFRVCRDASFAVPLTVTVSGSGDDVPNLAVAKNLLTIQNADIIAFDYADYISGQEILVLPETVIEGREINLFIDEWMK